MENWTKATLALAMLPVGSEVAIAAPHTPANQDLAVRLAQGSSDALLSDLAVLIAQTIAPTDSSTQAITSDGGNINITGGTQAAGNLFHSFDQFDLGQHQTANFITTPQTEAVISNVIGGKASTIDGLLQVTGSNADLYLVNPAGLLFGPHARLDLSGSFTATTASHIGDGDQWFDVLSNPDYDNLVTAPSHFGFSRTGTITNQGQLAVSAGQSLRLLSTQVINTGSLTAPAGEVTLFSASPGQTIHLSQPGSLLSLEISTDSTNSLPALITGGNLDHSSELMVNADGSIVLSNGGSPDAVITNTGDISTQGGGTITLSGPTIRVSDGNLDASGNNGGGAILIGGDYQGQGSLPRAAQTIVAENTRLIADAIQHGDGGQIIVWSDGITAFDGTASAKSTTGNGGLVETSGLNQLIIGDNAQVTTLAGQGENGLWLLDPIDLTITDSSPSDFTLSSISDVFGNSGLGNSINAPGSTIRATRIINALDGTNVTLQATNSITVDSAIDTSGNGSGGNLSFNTDILNLNQAITLLPGSELSGTADTVNVRASGSIQNAVDAVADGGTVNLGTTTYREGNTVTLDHALTLQGQGQDNTFISGDTNSDGSGDHQVFNVTGNNVVISDLTIQDGRATTDGGGLENSGNNLLIRNTTFINNEVASSAYDGGAIHSHGSIILNNTVFENNRTGSDGGAIDIEQGSVDIRDSIFINNQANDHGGAIDIDGLGSATITDSNFSSNTSGTNGGGIFSNGDLTIEASAFGSNMASESGGAVYLDNNNSNITNSSFTNNTAQRGGGIYNQSNLSLEGSLVEANQAIGLGSQDGGGGLLNTAGGNTRVESSIIRNNLSSTLGGGILNWADGSQTEIEINNSAIIGNQAATLGGGIEIASNSSLGNLSQAEITNSTISQNQADVGGGIRTVGPTALTNVTITNNTAISSGGGLSENITTASTPELVNTIVAGNSAPINPDVEGQFTDQGHNLIGNNQGSTGFDTSTLVGSTSNPIDPRLALLDSGPIPSHQLLNDSPAANAGSNLAATATDQHGQPRIFGDTVDIGATESNILPPVILTEGDNPPPVVTTPPNQPATLPETEAPQTAPPQFSPWPIDDINANVSSLISQEEKPQQTFEQTPISFATPDGRLRYFDEEAFQYLEESFSQEYEDYWHLPQAPSMTLQAVQQTLQQANGQYQSRSAVIYAVFVPQASTDTPSVDRFVLPRSRQSTNEPSDQLMLILVTADGKPIQHLVNVSRAELTQQTRLFRLAVADPEDPLSYKALARQMYGWLLAPLQSKLTQQGIDHVMYSLDQGLRTIPLAAMMEDDTFVIEQYGLSVIPSMGLLQPQFGQRSPGRSLIAGANQFATFSDLPAVPIELDIVSQRTQVTQVLLNEAFTLENFLNLQTAQQPDLLHLATHAEFNAGNLDQSFIQFWDKQLTFNQMRDLSWPGLELLILSACGTAISSPEAELGFTGLAAAAGIETSIGSLWNVSDVGTLALMAEFYNQLSTTPRRLDALQAAQLSLLQGNTHIHNDQLNTSTGDIALPNEWDMPTSAEFNHPFYWAGFTMVGNPWQ